MQKQEQAAALRAIDESVRSKDAMRKTQPGRYIAELTADMECQYREAKAEGDMREAMILAQQLNDIRENPGMWL